MPFTGDENHRITLSAARLLTQRHRAQGGGQAGPRAHYLGRAVIEEILAQPGCVGLRIYDALLEHGEPTVVVVGVTADGGDLADGVIAEEARPCPPYCAPTSPLDADAE